LDIGYMRCHIPSSAEKKNKNAPHLPIDLKQIFFLSVDPKICIYRTVASYLVLNHLMVSAVEIL